MKSVSDSIYSFFTSESDVTNVISTRLYPAVAKEGTQKPFGIYTINEEAFSKDGDAVSITLSLYFDEEKYSVCTAFADTCKEVIKNNGDYTWQSSSVGFVHEDQSIVATINFETIYDN